MYTFNGEFRGIAKHRFSDRMSVILNKSDVCDKQTRCSGMCKDVHSRIMASMRVIGKIAAYGVIYPTSAASKNQQPRRKRRGIKSSARINLLQHGKSPVIKLHFDIVVQKL